MFPMSSIISFSGAKAAQDPLGAALDDFFLTLRTDPDALVNNEPVYDAAIDPILPSSYAIEPKVVVPKLSLVSSSK